MQRNGRSVLDSNFRKQSEREKQYIKNGKIDIIGIIKISIHAKLDHI
jgi:hypothetical protein